MVTCPICRSGTYFLASKKDAYGQDYQYYRCQACDFLFDKALASDSAVLQKKISNTYHGQYFQDIDYGWKERGESYSGKINSLLRIFSFFKRGRISVLDYGGGNGYIASKLNDQFDIFYYDKYVKPAYPGNYHIIFEPQKADVVLAVEVVEHITDLPEWENIANLAANVFLFTTEISDGMSNKELSNWWYLRPDVGHVAIYSSKSLRIMAKRHGFAYFFFPSKSFHIFIRSPWLKHVNLVALEYPLYNFLRTAKHLCAKLFPNGKPNMKA